MVYTRSCRELKLLTCMINNDMNGGWGLVYIMGASVSPVGLKQTQKIGSCREIIKVVECIGKSHIIIDMFLNTYHPIIYYTVHEISMQYIIVNPIYNIKLLSFLTNDPHTCTWGGGLTLQLS